MFRETVEGSMNTLSRGQEEILLDNLLGDNVALSQSVRDLLLQAYKQGRSDTLEMLGIEEDDLPGDGEMAAWSA